MRPEPPTTQEPWTVGRLLNWTAEFLGRHGVDEPRLAAEILLAHALNCQRIQLYTRFEEVPQEAVRATFRELVGKAARHTPIAYLVGHKEFFSIDFEVTPDVLIPRPETETLVERAVESCRKRSEAGEKDETPQEILDLGTGSGCIIIAMLTQLPQARGTATDASAAALEVARRNTERHQVGDRLTLVGADCLKLPAEVVPEHGFDLIVSNPPYVADSDLHTLAPTVREHEPAMALTPGGDGLSFFRTIAADAPAHLRPQGVVMVEIGIGQSEPVKAIFTGEERLTHVGTYRGPSDPHDRVMCFAKV